MTMIMMTTGDDRLQISWGFAPSVIPQLRFEAWTYFYPVSIDDVQLFKVRMKRNPAAINNCFSIYNTSLMAVPK